MSRLITLGCSLTYDIGMKERLAELLAYDLISHAQTAGSNGLQINKFHEYVLENDVDEQDLVLWQITSPTRNHVRLYPNIVNTKKVKDIQEKDFAPNDRYHYIQNSMNVFDNLSRLDMLCNSPYSLVEFDSNEQLQNILTNIVLCSKIYPKTMILFGWSQMLNDKEKDIFFQYLDRHNVQYIKEFYVDWIKNNKLKMWDDDYHPAPESGAIFAEQVIMPKLQELSWI